jgi:hypothetical protein
MEMHQLRYFLAVCDTLNFTRAAETCHVTQPALTRAVQKLEKELGGARSPNHERPRLRDARARGSLVGVDACVTTEATMLPFQRGSELGEWLRGRPGGSPSGTQWNAHLSLARARGRFFSL